MIRSVKTIKITTIKMISIVTEVMQKKDKKE